MGSAFGSRVTDVSHLEALVGALSSKATLAPKRHRAGTHRVAFPIETLDRIRGLMHLMGITRIANITGLDCIGIPVVMVVRPNSRQLSTSQGKGIDLHAAMASGLMEAVEGYHAERIGAPRVAGAYDDLRSARRVVDVDLLPQSAEATFDPTATMLWIEGYDILQGEAVLVPYDVAHVDFRTDSEESAFFTRSSNGLGSGNHLLEAISHAICELVERDAVALTELEDEEVRNETLIDSGTVTDPACRLALERFDAAGVAVVVWDNTTEIGLPTFSCLIADDARSHWRLPIGGGSGCHPDRNIALLRALTEAAQSRLTIIAGSRDDTFPDEYRQFASDELLRKHVSELSGTGRRDVHEIPTYETETIDDDVRLELELLAKAGFERTVAVDLSLCGIGVPVVRMVIPGLEMGLPWPETRYGTRALAVLRGRWRRSVSRAEDSAGG